MGKTSKRMRGRSDLLTQWLVKYGYVPIALIGIAGLALDNFTREWKGGEIIVGDDHVVAETFVERRLPTVEITVEQTPTAPVVAQDSVKPPSPTVETRLEPKPTIQLAALNPDVRLPNKISATSNPHTNNIRAEIEQAAMLFDVDVQMMNAFAKIESAYNPKARTGSYKCL